MNKILVIIVIFLLVTVFGLLIIFNRSGIPSTFTGPPTKYFPDRTYQPAFK